MGTSSNDESASDTENASEETASEKTPSEETPSEETPSEGGSNDTASDNESKENGEEQNETSTEESSIDEKEEPKEKKTKLIQKEKKKTHKKSLDIETYHVGKVQPLSNDLIEEYKSNIATLAELDKQRVLLEEAKNKLESYFYYVKNKLLDDEETVAKISTEEQREELTKLSRDPEDWLFDEGDSADLETIEAKYVELATPAEKVWFRLKQMVERPAAVKA